MRTPKLLASLSAIGLCAALLPRSEAANLLVPKQYSTIQSAIDAAAPSDVIRVASGVYHESLQITGKTDLRVVGLGKVTIQGGPLANQLVVKGCDGLGLENLRLAKGEANGIVALDVHGFRVIGCHVDALAGTGIAIFTCPGARIEDNVVSKAGVDGIAIYTSLGSVVRKNDVRKSGGRGIRVISAQVTVEENSLTDNAGAAIELGDLELGPTEQCLIVANEIRKGSVGIRLVGVNHEISLIENLLVGTGGDGINIAPGSMATLLEGNVIVKPDGDGIHSRSTFTQAIRNTTKKTGTYGLLIENGSSGYYFDNRFLKSGVDGILVSGTDNVFASNTAKKSKALDLRDFHPGENLFIDNSFGTTN